MAELDLKNYRNRHSPRSKLARLLWEVTWLLLFRPTPRWCLNCWRRFLLRLFGARIGRGVRIRSSARFWQPWTLSIGDYSWIDERASIYSVDRISIGSSTVISEGAFICTASHDIGSATFDLVTKPISIGDRAWIAARAIVLPGVAVGDGAVVAAGAVATHDVEPWTIVAGNPARPVKARKLAD